MPDISIIENTLGNENDMRESVGEGSLELTEIPRPPPNLPSNEDISQTGSPSDSPGNIANQEIAIKSSENQSLRVKKEKTIVITAIFSRSQRNRNSYDRYVFDNQKTPLAVVYASKKSQKPATFSKAMKVKSSY